MSNEVKAAKVQGKYGLVATILAAIISGLFNVFSINYIDKLMNNIDTLTEEKEDLTSQLYNTQSELSNIEKLYSEQRQQYSDIENEYLQLNKSFNELEGKYEEIVNSGEKVEPIITEEDTNDKIWIDKIDIFYQEGRHISGIKSDGWCKIWDPSVQKDSLGNEHNHGIYVRGFREDTYILEYILEDAYVGFKGLFTLEYESRNIPILNNLKIYGIKDDEERELLYSTEQALHGGIKPIPFDAPVYGYDHVRIEISSDTGKGGEFFIGLVDACFYK